MKGEQKKEYHRNYYLRNSEKFKSERRAYYANNKATVNAYSRAYQLKQNYGLSVEDYDAMLVAQDGKCGICKTAQKKGRGGFHVDHCHATGKVRGLLCVSCNMSLGWYERRLSAVAAYLKKDAS